MALPYPLSSIPSEVFNLFKLGAWAWAAPVAACVQFNVSAEDITDAIFFLRHPERFGKKLAADEKKLIAEWKAIQADVVTVLDLVRRPTPPPHGSGPPWMRYARAEMTRWGGMNESDTKADEQYFQASPYFGGKRHVDGYVLKKDLAWCAAFVNWCLHRSGYSHTGSGSNGSFLKDHLWHFDALEEPKEGCVIVLGHGLVHTDSDHVALLSTWKNLPKGRNVGTVDVAGSLRVSLLGGNQSATVMDKSYYNVKLFAAKGQNGATSPYLWPKPGPANCKVRCIPTDGGHACGLNPASA